MSSIKARLGKFDTVDEFVEGYGQYFFRGGILLPTRRAKEEGERVALHIQIASGESVLRGEGIVQQVRTNAQGGTVGMVIRFTRLDRSSKELVDRIMNHRREKRTRDVPAATPPPAPPAPARSDEGAELALETFGAIAEAIETSIDSIFSGAIQTGASGEGSESEYVASLGDLAATAREVDPEDSANEPAQAEGAPLETEDAGDSEPTSASVEDSPIDEAAVEPQAAKRELPPSSQTTRETAIQLDADDEGEGEGEGETSGLVAEVHDASVSADAPRETDTQSIDEPPTHASTPEAGDTDGDSGVADGASEGDGAGEVRLDWIGDDYEEVADEVTAPRAEESAPRARIVGPDHLAGGSLFGNDASASGASSPTPTTTPVVPDQDDAPAKTVMGMPAVQLDALERANAAPPEAKPVKEPRSKDTAVGGAREASAPPEGDATLAKLTLERTVAAPEVARPPVPAEDEEPQEAVHQFIKALTQKTQAIGADPRRVSPPSSATAGGSAPVPPPTQDADPAPAAFEPPPTKKDDTRSAFEASMDRAAASAEEGEAALDDLVSGASKEAPLPAPMTGALQAIPSSKSHDQGLIARIVDWFKGLFDR